MTPATNLFQHLQREHYDLLRGVQIPQFPPPITLPPPPPTLFPPFVNINAYESTSSESYEESPSSSPRSGICRLGTQLVKIDEYVEYTVSKGGQECIICTENLETGDRAARLQCLCVYHKSCIGTGIIILHAKPRFILYKRFHNIQTVGFKRKSVVLCIQYLPITMTINIYICKMLT